MPSFDTGFRLNALKMVEEMGGKRLDVFDAVAHFRVLVKKGFRVGSPVFCLFGGLGTVFGLVQNSYLTKNGS